MKISDIDTQHVVDLAHAWRISKGDGTGVVRALLEEGIPEKLARAKVLKLIDQGILECGTSVDYAWPVVPQKKKISDSDIPIHFWSDDISDVVTKHVTLVSSQQTVGNEEIAASYGPELLQQVELRVKEGLGQEIAKHAVTAWETDETDLWGAEVCRSGVILVKDLQGLQEAILQLVVKYYKAGRERY